MDSEEIISFDEWNIHPCISGKGAVQQKRGGGGRGGRRKLGPRGDKVQTTNLPKKTTQQMRSRIQIGLENDIFDRFAQQTICTSQLNNHVYNVLGIRGWVCPWCLWKRKQLLLIPFSKILRRSAPTLWCFNPSHLCNVSYQVFVSYIDRPTTIYLMYF